MSKTDKSDGYRVAFPALTPGQRLFLEVNGYVVIENTLNDDETGRMLEALQRLKRQFEAADDPEAHRVNGCQVAKLEPCFASFSHILETDPACLEYLTHRRLVGLAEELVGGRVRLEESAAIINSRDPKVPVGTDFQYGFHRGSQPGLDSYIYDDLTHCLFVKTLTNLTELGPDDGGTAVIAGSHKLNCDGDDLVQAAYADPSLIHQVVAPAGSTLLFSETLIHASGPVRSDRERTIIIGGYSHPKSMAMYGEQPSSEFLAALPEHLQELIAGKPLWTWPERHRTLGMAADMDDVPYEARMWSVPNP